MNSITKHKLFYSNDIKSERNLNSEQLLIIDEFNKKINLLVNGNGIPDNFKNNSLFFYNKYQESTKEVLGVSVTDIQPGGFYFIHYLDTSSWMQFSPVFVSKLPVGSSAKITSGSFAKDLAIATLCLSPPLNSEGL